MTARNLPGRCDIKYLEKMVSLIPEHSLFCNINIPDLFHFYYFLLSELLGMVLTLSLCPPGSCVGKPVYLGQSHQ